MKALLLAAVLAFVGCSADVRVESKPSLEAKLVQPVKPDILAYCPDSAYHAVMLAAGKQIPGHYNDVTVREDGVSQADIVREQNAIDKIFAWSKSLPDADVRGCYESWLGFYQYELDSAREEIPKLNAQRAWERTHQVPVMKGSEPNAH